jgi:hypothetical protein
VSDNRCPVCGGPVRVGGNGTTMYYIPVLSPEVKRLVEAVRAACEEWWSITHQLVVRGSEPELVPANYDLFISDLQAALEPFEEDRHGHKQRTV